MDDSHAQSDRIVVRCARCKQVSLNNQEQCPCGSEYAQYWRAILDGWWYD